MSELGTAVGAGDRRALARAITLVESTRPDHHEEASELLTEIMPATGNAVRVGISGAPGTGKSTFIEVLGLHVLDEGHRVAVLAVDPSSTRSGGSILGDKTRMEELTRAEDAFVRPSPTGGTLGGVARRTREAMLLCEAAGFDVVIVETVGVGQSEVAVAGMVDCFVLVLAPGGGDELQGIKRGIMELADIVVVNKADGDLAAAADHAAADVGRALHLLRPRSSAWSSEVVRVSSLERRGIHNVWQTIGRFRDALGDEIGQRRRDQARDWMWSEVSETLMASLREDEAVAALVPELEEAVTAGRLAPSAAAQQLLATFRS
jgi:LAO/AO transport system kinase